MRNDLFQSINSFTLNNVEDKLKQPFSEVLKIVKNTEAIYGTENLEKLEIDLKENKLNIKVEPVHTSKDSVGADMDRVSYGYGYIDFGKESIVYTGKLNKKIVVWREIATDFDSQTVIKALVFLLDMYLSLNEKAVFSNYSKISEELKRNKDFEYRLPTDIYKNVPIGGFRLSVIDKWCGFYATAISDLISTNLTKTNLFFNRRSKFMNTVLLIHGQSLKELIENRKNNNINYFYSLLPERSAKMIGFWGIVFENYEFKNYADYMVRKVKLECSIYDYISSLYYDGIMDNHSKDNQEEYISNLLELSNTLYDENVKVDFRDSIKA